MRSAPACPSITIYLNHLAPFFKTFYVTIIRQLRHWTNFDFYYRSVTSMANAFRWSRDKFANESTKRPWWVEFKFFQCDTPGGKSTSVIRLAIETNNSKLLGWATLSNIGLKRLLSILLNGRSLSRQLNFDSILSDSHFPLHSIDFGFSR